MGRMPMRPRVRRQSAAAWREMRAMQGAGAVESNQSIHARINQVTMPAKKHGGKRDGSGRKPGRKNITRSVSFTAENFAKLERMSGDAKRSPFINQLIQERQEP